MNNNKPIHYISFFLLILDQIIKLLIQKNMSLYQEITIIPSFFTLYYVKNTGAAFSILQDSSSIILLISILSIITINYYIVKEKKMTKLSKISFGLLLGGIYGNLLDRIIHKSVIDYLSFSIFNYSFPIFNLADIGITVGVGLIILETILEKEAKNIWQIILKYLLIIIKKRKK